MTLARRIARDRLLLLASLALLAVAAAYAWIGYDRGDVERPAGPLLIADLRGHALLVMDLEHPREARRIALPGAPHELARLDGGRVAVSLEREGALALVDIAAGSVETLEIGGTPHGLAVHDGVLYVTDRSIDAVRRLRLDGWLELPALPAGIWPHAVGVLPDGSLVTANAGDDALRIGDRMLTVSDLPETVALSPDGERIAVAGALGGALEVFDVAGVSLVRVALGGRPVRVVFAPAGDLVAVALSADASVALVDGQGTVRRVPVGGVPDGLAFDATGRFLMASDLFGGTVSVIDVAAGRVSAALDGGASAGALLTLARSAR